MTLLGGAAALAPLGARAQQPDRMRRIGVLMGVAHGPESQAALTAFVQRLQQLGWMDRRNLSIEYRWGDGDTERTRMFAKELVELNPDVIFCQTTQSVEALRQVSRTIPFVFVQVSDPVGSGFVGSLARPAGNATGFTNFESSMGGKWLELLKEIVPRIARAALMFNPSSSPHIAGGYYLHALGEAARQFTVELFNTPVQNAAEIARAINTFVNDPRSGLIVLPDTFNIVHADLIIALASRHRLPAVYPFSSFARNGGLMSYGNNPIDQYPRAASYVDRILRGEKVAELPVQAPTKYELVINLKAAKAIGLMIPESFLLRADEVLE
jgi:putative ABC transport system substrate-binding protein